MAHCLDVISCGSSKSMHNSLFSLYSIMPWFSLVGFIGYIKLKTVKDNPEKTPGKKTTTPFSYINDVSVDLDKVCLHITYLFLKKLTVGDVSAIVFLLALLSHENLYSLPEAVWRVFSKESTPLVVQQSPLPRGISHWFKSLFYLFIYSIDITNIIFLTTACIGTFFHRFSIPYSFSVSVSVSISVIPFSGFRIPCLSAALRTRKTMHDTLHENYNHQDLS